jgi:putative mRNA 3-end processing factor
MDILRHDLYIGPAGAYIDPPFPVEKALITHAHGDHAIRGHKHVLATQDTIGIMKQRYGEDAAGSWQPIAYGEKIQLGSLGVSFHPAGHILGSAQILLESPAKRIVVSGDYKRGRDAGIAAFEPVPCDIFVTEATFGLPVFQHPDPLEEAKKLVHSLAKFPQQSHLVAVYALGKAQRLISLVRQAGYDAPIYLHGSMVGMCRYYQRQGVDLGALRRPAEASREELKSALILTPPSALKEIWSRRFPDPITGMASGWMTVKQRVRQRGIELPLVISDHADWNELTQTIRDTGAPEVWVTHGREDALVHWCHKNGLHAKPLRLQGRDDEEEAAA